MTIGDGGLGIEVKYSQFPLHTPRLHCAQPMREDSNLGVPSDVNSPSLTQKPQDELTSPSLTITNHSSKPWSLCKEGASALLMWSDGTGSLH